MEETRVYHVFSGIDVIYFVIPSCSIRSLDLDDDVIEINHCREGRCECYTGERAIACLTKGALSISGFPQGKGKSVFPEKEYRGITVMLKISEFSDKLKNTFSMLGIDVSRLKDRIDQESRKCCILKSAGNIEHIFSELYNISEERREAYLKIKVFELLMFLSDVDYSHMSCYHTKSRIDKVMEIGSFIKSDPRMHYTLEELSKKFDIPLTAMKECFKNVYGTTIYAYFRAFRIETAIKLLDSGKTVAEASEAAGYENPNKFTSAFKAEKGITPSQYIMAVRMDRQPSDR